jgi:phage terminase Nu1 subunit (DNA packaging protein)
VVFFSPSTDRLKPARCTSYQPTPENSMTTKKKAGAKASVKAAPVRRHKPGPAARRKMREARAAALYTQPQSAAFPAVSYKNGRVAADLTASEHAAKNLSARISGTLSPAEVEHEQKLAHARLVNAQAEAQEIANRRERANPSGNVHYNFQGECAAEAAAPGVAKQRQISEETAMLEKAQDFTAELLDKLTHRLTSVLRADVPNAGEQQAKALSDRSPLADWVRQRADHQARFNTTLVNLLHRLDID